VVEFLLFKIEAAIPGPGLNQELLGLAAGLAIGWWLHHIQRGRFNPLRFLSVVPRKREIAMAILLAMSVAGRLAFWHWKSAPHPSAHDEFGYLLAADTFAHGRLTNPTPEFWTHFETYHELMRPTYMPKYPPGQGLFLALGQVVFGSAFAGVLLSCGLMCAALYWALAGMMPQRWAFLGAALAVVRISWSSYWDNSYWGGAVAALGGCLVVGAAVRLNRRRTARDAGILATGLWLLAISRPYEGMLLAVPVCLFVLVQLFRTRYQAHFASAVATFAVIFALGMSWLAYDNWRVTGHFAEAPYSEFVRQYQWAPPLLFGAPRTPVYNSPSTQKNEYVAPDLPRYIELRTFRGFIKESISRPADIWSFFLDPGLGLLMLFGLVLCAKNRQLRWVWITLGFMVVGWEAEIWDFPHYFAPALPILSALGMFGLRALYSWRRTERTGAMLVTGGLLGLAVAFAPLPLIKLLNRREPASASFRAAGDFRKSRVSVIAALTSIPGDHLVLIRYRAGHLRSTEWVYNGHDIPSQRIIWAHDLDPEDSDQPLICHYHDRHVWMLEPIDGGAWTPQQAKEALKPVNTDQVCGGAPGAS
jgi:hypothetical protein